MKGDGTSIWKRGFLAVMVFVALAATTLLLPSISTALVYDDPLTTSNLRIRSGTGSFSSLTDEVKRVNAQPGATLSGTIRLDTSNGMDSAFVAPLIWTRSWGAHYASFETIEPWIGTGVREHTVDISFTAPEEPGTYYLIFAFNAEYNGSQVASLTNWRYYDEEGTVSWGDGNDVADLSSSKIAEVQANGRTNVSYQFNGWSQGWTLPADAVTIVVGGRSDGATTFPDWVPIAFGLTAIAFVGVMLMIRRSL
jgi:hypothetical protein